MSLLLRFRPPRNTLAAFAKDALARLLCHSIFIRGKMFYRRFVHEFADIYLSAWWGPRDILTTSSTSRVVSNEDGQRRASSCKNTTPAPYVRYSSKTPHRVVITLTNTDKHALPVESGCPYAHRNSLALTNRTAPCRNMSESAGLTGQAGLHRCVMDAACEITDNRLQMSVNRDPR